MFDFEAAIARVQAAATIEQPVKPVVKRTRKAHKPVVIAAQTLSRSEKLADNDLYFRRNLRWG